MIVNVGADVAATATGSGWSEERTRAIVDQHRDERGPLLPILHALQEEFGFIDPRAVPVVADALNLSRAEVHGVVTFYRDFRDRPPGRTVVRVCQAEACQARGADELVEHACRTLEVALGETTSDQAFTLDHVFCLGNCSLGPSVVVGERLHGRVTPARLDALLAFERSDAGGKR